MSLDPFSSIQESMDICIWNKYPFSEVERTIQSYNPAINKKIILAVTGIIWLGLSTLLIRKGVFYFLNYSHHLILNAGIGLVTGFFAFAFVFSNLVKKRVFSVINQDDKKLGFMIFSGINGFIMISLLILAAILLSKFHFIGFISLNIFYVSVGISLFLGALKFFISVMMFKKYLSVKKTSI